MNCSTDKTLRAYFLGELQSTNSRPSLWRHHCQGLCPSEHLPPHPSSARTTSFLAALCIGLPIKFLYEEFCKKFEHCSSTSSVILMWNTGPRKDEKYYLVGYLSLIPLSNYAVD
jgi:hypothetical protein